MQTANETDVLAHIYCMISQRSEMFDLSIIIYIKNTHMIIYNILQLLHIHMIMIMTSHVLLIISDLFGILLYNELNTNKYDLSEDKGGITLYIIIFK